MRWTDADYQTYRDKQDAAARNLQLEKIAISHGLPGPVKQQKQTKAEMEYGRFLALEFPRAKIIPWGVTLRMANGHKYTPDYFVQDDNMMMLVEVKQRGKNGFRQHSYQRAKLAYDQCKVEYPLFCYRWAEKHNGKWSSE